ncbi:MAG: polyketide synthase dehydratase domain-containing protein, partial [Oscillospiraceae bacterium]|nr:polyketide synthase dehydratase domain-containing protein [Oscillospiraceae bacterium]
MMNLNLNLNLNLNDSELLCEDAVLHPIQEPEGVAIIGMDVKAGSATSKEAVWQAFRDGLDMITELPEERLSDAVNFAKIAYGKDVEAFSQRAYLPRIDTFEPELFKLSRREAELMDPVQRLFLESAWCALEDAGYGGGRLAGSKTGVFVGFNQVGDSYESLLQDIPEEMLGIKLSGNTTSFLASRISYLLDLKGPAMVIDTACSSSLVALHEACEALKGKEIDTAIVGSIRIFFCPERTGENIGTTSTTERTRSFDGSADGTGGGEGVINLILKPLCAAVRDRDHVYGVIKGSCANQDGSSIGITAPNSAAQEQCILEAWEKADVHPEQISYIEAHGTATRLGDPVEIGGLTGAFSHFTRKKQFCALGAAKSNFGHLDCCSGLLGVVKLLLMMEHQMIPPSLHFTYPNAKIDYVDSPIFMNDVLRPWESEDGVLTAGVSSFGLSGTNCHVILQSYPNSSLPCTLAFRRQILTVSARTKESLKRYLLTLQDFLKERNDIRLEDLCYSLNIGRTKHACRFAMVISGISEFLNLREEELLSSAYYGQYRLVSEEADEEGFLSVSNKNKLTALASDAVISMDVDTLAKVYLQGADVDFAPLYENATVKMISLPAYAFSKVRCWYESKALTQIPAAKETSLHPLLDRCATQSFGIRIYEKRISLDSCMELREHRINGVCVLPGTAYVEMICEIGKQFYGAKPFRFDSVMFFSLLTCEKGETKLLHCVVREDADKLCIDIASREVNGQWTRHAEGVLSPCKLDIRPKTDLGAFLSAYSRVSS